MLFRDSYYRILLLNKGVFRDKNIIVFVYYDITRTMKRGFPNIVIRYF